MKNEKESLQQLLLRIWKRKLPIENKSTGYALIFTPLYHRIAPCTPNTEPNTVFSDHRIHALLERSIDAAKKLESIYEDEDGLRKEEVSKIGGPNEFKEFYERDWFEIILFHEKDSAYDGALYFEIHFKTVKD